MDKDFWLDLTISTVLREIKASVKNPERKAKLRPAMLKIAASIFALWNDDGSFAEAVEARASYENQKLRSL